MAKDGKHKWLDSKLVGHVTVFSVSKEIMEILFQYENNVTKHILNGIRIACNR
jgi:hypothetical protein